MELPQTPPDKSESPISNDHKKHIDNKVNYNSELCLSKIIKLNYLGWFDNNDIHNFFKDTSLKSYYVVFYYALLKYGWMYQNNINVHKSCFFCKQEIKNKHVLLRCGCRFHGNCINKSKFVKYYITNVNKTYECPQCMSAANLIKKQFKESYTNPYYDMCKRRLIRDYNEICDAFTELNAN